MSLFAELKRRNVFRVGAAYVVVAWLLLQVVDVVAPILELPDSAAKLILLIIAIGFVPTLIFAWAFELTPEGVKREKDVDRSKSVTGRTGQKLNRVIIGVLAFVILMLAAERFWMSGTDRPATETGLARLAEPESPPPISDEPPAPADKSIAVLPFANRSAGAENTRFFSDGIHDDLLTMLSKIQKLKVISRTSVMAYRDTTRNMREIGDKLGVTTLLEGGVQQAGDRVRINVQLINAKTDEHLWAESYDRKVTTENIFEIQGEIARAIANALKAKLTTEEKDALGKAPTGNLEAYRAVLISRQISRRGGFNSFNQGVEYARKAIRLDPEYPDAHLALAFNLSQGINTGTMTDGEVGAEISAAIDTAMSLEPNYDEAWSELGHYLAAAGKPGADEAFEKAMLLNPGNAKTLYPYGFMLQSTGRPEEALPLLLKSSELDPLSANVLFALGRTYTVLEEYEAARRIFARIREIEPSSPLGYSPNSGTYYPQGLLGDALYWLRAGLAVDPQDFELGGWMVFLNDSLEDYATATEWSDWLDSWVTNQPGPMAMQAGHHYLTGNFETAVQYANLALNLGLPNRWGSDSIFMRIKRDEALANGDPESGIEAFRAQHPGLFEAKPEITPANVLQAVDLALLLKMSGKPEETRTLLGSVIDFYDQPWSTTGSVRALLVPAKAEALAILGEEQRALAELRRIVDKGWRLNWRWETDLNQNFNGIRESAEFRAILGELEADMNEQRAIAQAMADKGEIAPPPEIGSR
jgi:TolB-like protein/Tfp pilus assembly protein PilF